MTAKDFKEIELSKLDPNPWNPRSDEDFRGQKFDELVASIRAKGVYSPILVRPKKKGRYEIIFGERRFRASCVVAQENGGLKKAKIPALVREMSDDDAFDACLIENLQREDLTELQEANTFKAWVERRAKKDRKADVVKDLSDRTGKGARYIRRRLAVLALPAEVLKAWDKGLITIGHCEQLTRLTEKKQILEFLSNCTERWDPLTVSQLREAIDDEAVPMKKPWFDLAGAGCNICQKNTDVQRELLFGDEMEQQRFGSCLDPQCYEKYQREALTADWEEKYRKKWGTNGFRFYEGYNQPKHQAFGKDHYGCKHKEPGEKCADCKDLVTILEVSGKVYCKQACLNEKCYTLLKAKKETRIEKERIGGDSAPGPGEPAGPEAPRVAWHGEHFREEFYQEIMPSWIEALPADDDKILRLTLSAILNSNRDAKNEFFIRYFDKKRQDGDPGGCYGRVYHHVTDEQVWALIEGMDAAVLRLKIKELVQYITLHQPTTDHRLRGLIASHLGIDLARDWRINASYLEKKTKAEILAFGEQLGIFADPKAEAFLKDTLGKRKFSALKKAELDRVILESGVDLSGKVPAEILDVKDEPAAGYRDDPECPRDEAGLCSYMRRRICKHQGEAVCCRVCDDSPENYDGDEEACNSYCPKIDGEPVCRVCGCSDEDGCEGGCRWVKDDLCSACQGKEGEA